MNKKSFRSIIAIALAYALCVSVVMSVFFHISGAKYRSTVIGHTNFGVAQFNAMILQNFGINDQNQQTVESFGKDGKLNLSDCYPGMTARYYPFKITNGESATEFSETEIVYTVKVRSMRNIPLSYSLVYYTGGNSDPASTYPASEPVLDIKTDTNSKADDAKWYSSVFRISSSTDAAAEFVLRSGELDVHNLALKVEWPVSEAITEDDISTNSTYYMREVEVVEVVVSVSSANVSADPNYGKDDQGQEIVIPFDYYGYGMVIVDAEHSKGSYVAEGKTVYNYSYTVDYRAFKPKEEGSNSSVYEYDFEVNNGNNFVKYDTNHQIIPHQSDKYTLVRFSVMVPYTPETIELGAFSLISGETTYAIKSDSVKYLCKNVEIGSPTYGTTEEITVQKVEADANNDDKCDIFEDNDGKPYFLKKEYYMVYSFYVEGAAANDPVTYLYNQNVNGITDNDFSQYSERKLKLVITDTAGEFSDFIEATDHRTNFTFDIITEAVGSDVVNGKFPLEGAVDLTENGGNENGLPENGGSGENE